MVFDSVLRTAWPESGYIDIHCHRVTVKNKLEIVSIDTQDFTPDVSTHGLYTLGIHPWFIDRQDSRTALDKIAAAVSHDPNLLAIGECGLDKAISTPLMLQIEVFNSQVMLAEQAGKPLIIHCVRAFNELLRIKKDRKSTRPWIIHGFNGNPVLARQLLKHGCYLSFGGVLLHGWSNASRALAGMSLERLFLETDAADVPISAIYAAAAKIAGLDVKTLQLQIMTNFQRVFLHD